MTNGTLCVSDCCVNTENSPASVHTTICIICSWIRHTMRTQTRKTSTYIPQLAHIRAPRTTLPVYSDSPFRRSRTHAAAVPTASNPFAPSRTARTPSACDSFYSAGKRSREAGGRLIFLSLQRSRLASLIPHLPSKKQAKHTTPTQPAHDPES